MTQPASAPQTDAAAMDAVLAAASDLAHRPPRLLAFQAPVATELALVEQELVELLSSNAGLIGQVAGHVMVGVGKKFRPTLLLLCARASEGGRLVPDEDLRSRVRAAAVVELIHTATLIHDDSLDKSLLRRGLPTVNHLWNDDVSIIMGDYMYSKAFSTLVRNRLWDAMEILAETTNQMSVGEMMQIERRYDLAVAEADYVTMIGSKTASLVSAACEIGALFGDGAMRTRLARYGQSVGLAFQITDDLIDFLGLEEETGKPCGSDIKDGKVTLPLITALRNAPNGAADDIRELVRTGDLSDGRWGELVAFITEYGGVEYAEARARAFAASAKAELMSLPRSPMRDALAQAVDYVVARRT
jgi:octaprenyl-diphosphate synthase